jgi:hypothetical protein
MAWVEAWLTGREQRVVLNGECSDWADVLSGVPQGSLLGPPLFSVYINDIDFEVRLLITLLLKFADDTKLGQLIGSQQDTIRLQECLDRLMEWAARWGMAFNSTLRNAKLCMLEDRTHVTNTPWEAKFWTPLKKKGT